MSDLRLSQNLTENNFDENDFAAKSKIDLEKFRRSRKAREEEIQSF